MRIIAGEMRSRTILAPKGTDTRPTLDRTRESLFNINLISPINYFLRDGFYRLKKLRVFASVAKSQ